MQMSVPFRALVALAMLAGAGAPHAEPAPVAQAVAWNGKAPEPAVIRPEPTPAATPGMSEPSAYSLVLAGIGAAGWLARRRWRNDR
jgi:PEP-CTERM motif